MKTTNRHTRASYEPPLNEHSDTERCLCFKQTRDASRSYIKRPGSKHPAACRRALQRETSSSTFEGLLDRPRVSCRPFVWLSRTGSDKPASKWRASVILRGDSIYSTARICRLGCARLLSDKVDILACRAAHTQPARRHRLVLAKSCLFLRPSHCKEPFRECFPLMRCLGVQPAKVRFL